jgi:RNase P/RNase MRP subunit POP5
MNDATNVAQSIAHSLAEYLGDVHVSEVAARLRTYDGDERTRAFFSQLAEQLDELGAAHRCHDCAP